MQTGYKFVGLAFTRDGKLDGFCSSGYGNQRWIRGDHGCEMEATCDDKSPAQLAAYFAFSPTPTSDLPPHEHHSCGLYILSSLEELVRKAGDYGNGTIPVALSTWGKTIPYTYGHKAQFARIEAILPPKCSYCFRRAPFVASMPAWDFIPLCGIHVEKFPPFTADERQLNRIVDPQPLEEFLAPLGIQVSWDPVLDFGCIICEQGGHTFKEHHNPPESPVHQIAPGGIMNTPVSTTYALPDYYMNKVRAMQFGLTSYTG